MPPSNRLARETSPYLLQHANNPVDWYPWGEEALGRAVAESRPILLSVGYAACHWCHVMEHESFEDEATARLMNERFVNIKVDREERPDIDGIYMQAVQAMTGHGGWPMTVFLTPEGVPFYSGTYFPPDDRHGMPSFRRVLLAVSDAWEHRRADVDRTAATMRDLYASSAAGATAPSDVDSELLEHALVGIVGRFDPVNGGFEGAPKFPQAMALEFVLLRAVRRLRSGDAKTLDHDPLRVVRQSFLGMARGGIYDQVGGGFARYSVDAKWLVPHFEKMLYDNALLARLGAHLWQATKNAEVRRVVEETIDWVAREMMSPGGGFYSSMDADSEGHEGRFYVWTPAEIDSLLPPDEAEIVRAYYGVTPEGNFEGHSILHVPDEVDAVAMRIGVDVARVRDVLARAKRALYDVRAKRVWPGKDDKILTSWNALMLRAIAEAARAFDRDDYRKLALKNASLLFGALVRDGRVLRTHKNGESKIAGFLEDYAALGLAGLSLYELTFERRWLEDARVLGESVVQWFGDAGGGFFDTASDHEALITRPRDPTDNATPSGTSLAAELLARLGELLGDEGMRRRAGRVVETWAEPMKRYPSAFGHMLCVADMLVEGAVELALVGDVRSAEFKALERAAAERYVPSLVVAGGDGREDGVALLAGREMRDGRATAYVCRHYTCDEPVVDAEALVRQLAAFG
jgi:uncharacterized protein